MDKILTKEELQTYLDTLDKDIFIIAFYIRKTHLSQNEWMEALSAYLGSRGFLTIGILACGSDRTCALSNVTVSACVDDDKVRYLRKINVFIISDVDFQTEYPQESRILASPHGMIIGNRERPWGAMTHQLHNLAAIDGWLSPFPVDGNVGEYITSLWSNVIDPRQCRRKNSTFHIIPMGYLRLAAIAETLAAHPREPDSIVYAPVGSNFYLESGGRRLERYALRTLRVLLRSFPTMNVVFRPFKTDIENQTVKDICHALANEKRFSIDLTGGRTKAFTKGKILITDLSHIAQSFAFSTIRPAIFFQPWKKEALGPSIWAGGFYAYNFTTLVSYVRKCLENYPEITNIIKNKLDLVAMPPHSAFSGIAAGIRDFYNGESHADWLAIPRNNAVNLKTDVEIAEILVSRPPGSMVCAAAAASVYNPESPLLCALALHLGIVALPMKPLYYNLADIAGQLLGKLFYPSTYRDIDPVDIKRLFRRALSESTNRIKAAKIMEMCLSSQ